MLLGGIWGSHSMFYYERIRRRRRWRKGSPSHIRPTCNLIENGDILCIWAQPHGHRLRRTE